MTYVSNLQSFEKLKGICTGLGGSYKPGNGNLQVKALATLMSEAETAMAEVNEAKSRYDIATNERATGFAQLKQLGSQVCAQLRVFGVSQLTVQDALGFNRKIRGWRTRPKLATDGNGDSEATRSSISFSQAYVSLANYFAGMVELVEKEPKYQPAEPELRVEGLQATLARLQSLNQAVTLAEVRLAQAKRKRNFVFYERMVNLVKTARDVKHYVRSIYGFRSPEHLELVRLSFNKPSR